MNVIGRSLSGSTSVGNESVGAGFDDNFEFIERDIKLSLLFTMS